MIIAFFMTLAVLLGGVVLLILYVGRKYEARHNVGELNEEMYEDEQQLTIVEPIEESNFEENL